ncbi:MAG: S-layer homology domain-containing protein [Clostridia bacterium]|nr:S-layer homology domain-containing protein [Clostridia bacterium]
MSRTKRVLALVVTALMALSMLTVITFAATPVFFNDYVDPNGVIKNTAYMVNAAVGSYKSGDAYVTEWDGTAYQFTVGKNAFADIDSAVSAAEVDPYIEDRIQLMLASGDFGELRISSSIDIFGVNWNNSPNTVNPEDPTLPWTYNPDWTDSSTNVTNIVIEGSVNEEVNVWGVKVTGRIYDNYRPISSAKTVVRFKNIAMEQDDLGVSTFYDNSPTGRAYNVYAISLWNSNASNGAESAKYNADETYFINFRLVKLMTPCTRLIDEFVSPKITWEGCYFDDTMDGWTSNFGWLKWKDYMTDCSATIKGCMFANYFMKDRWQIESYNKNKVGNSFKEQYSELNIVDNIFYNNVGEGTFLTIFAHGFSQIHIDGNTVINPTYSGLKHFITFNTQAIGSDDYSNTITMRDNTVVGLAGFEFPYGSANSKVDMTGTYFKSSYSANWINETSTQFPTGKVRYDYCYLDAARTQKSNAVPPFTVNGIAPDSDAKTISIDYPAGTLSAQLNVSGLEKYEIYESNADFTNAVDYSRSNKVEECVLKNQKNYFLLIAYSYDLATAVAYKLTVNKAATSVDPGELVDTTSGAFVERNALEYNVSLDRNTENFSFAFDMNKVSVDEALNLGDNSELELQDGVYSVLGILPSQTVSLRFKLSKDGAAEYFYVTVTRGLSRECSVVSADGVDMNGDVLSATVPGNVAEFKFSVEISEGAVASVWSGTTVYRMDENGQFVIDDLVSGINEFTLGVTAENGVDYKLYNLVLDKEKSTEAVLYGIDGAVADGNGFTATARNKFVVNPEISRGATFKVFADASCSQLIEDNTVAIAKDTTVYIIVTSESGTNVSAPYALTIKKSDEGITVAGETVDESNPALRTVTLEDNLENVTLDITAKNASYKLYADKKLTTAASENITLDQGTTYVYAKVTYSDGESEIVTIKLVSNRTTVTYKDAAKIPNWAKPYINKLNDSGTGVLQGDDLGNFNASNSMTRYEIAAIAVRLLGIDATQYANVELEYTDTIAKWAENYVKAVTKLGIMSGSNNLDGQLVFDGKGNTTRAQLAKIIVELSFLDNEMTQSVDAYYQANKEAVDSHYNSFDFADEASVQNWAKTYMKLAVYANYFNGSEVNGRNYISGKDNIKRSEIAAVCTRYLGL